MEQESAGAGSEVFALTDEQIVGLGEDGAERGDADVEVLRDANDASLRMTNTKAADGQLGDADRKGLTPEGVSYRDGQTQEVPQWLAERMRDPRDGEAAKELWDGKQRAEKEIAAYREVFATASDARALKEIYPGGMAEAKAAAERARELDAIDAAFYRGDAAARMQLAQRMMHQDPGAFREMVEAGVRLLGADAKAVANEEKSRSLAGARDDNFGLSGGDGRLGDGDRNGLTPEGVSYRDGRGAEVQVDVAPEIVGAYREFEKAANLELEKSVGGAIARVMEQALPNLREMTTTGQAVAQRAAPLREPLTGAVREEVDAALRSDRELGEQVGRILAGRRFDDAARAQVVRLIDARAQQLVPGAVRRVVGSWTSATLGVRGKRGNKVEESSQVQNRPLGHPAGSEKATAPRSDVGANRGRRVDYGRMSDEEILRM
jgi:hypothetical protein